MARKCIFGVRPVTLATVVPDGLARRHSRRCGLRRFSNSSSTFLRSLRSMAVTPLLRSYGRSDSCPPDSGTLKLNACFTCGQVSLIHVTRSSDHSVSKHLRAPASPGHVCHGRVGPRLHPSLGISELRHCYAGSLHHADRIELRFLPPSGDVLRTGRSPPAAPHPISRRRSCIRLPS
jgi:hypothetical protein